MMDSNSTYHEESINSSEEIEQQEHVDLGVGRSYECVFCKRGFNTAQALGGHMNIHRKDRARNKPSTSSTKQEETSYSTYTGPRSYQQIPMSTSDYNHQSLLNHHHFANHDDDNQPHLNHVTYFPASTSSSARPLMMYGDHHHYQHPQYDFDRDHFQQPGINPCIPAGDWRMNLNLKFTQDLEKNSQVLMNQKEELDLELRLGYDS